MMRFLLAVLVLSFAMCAVVQADEQFTLVSPEWVAQHSGDANLVVLDVRADMSGYITGHVPNSVNVAANSLRGPKEGIPWQYLPVRLQAELLRRAGVKDNQTVVVYSDGADVPSSTMVAYILEKMGHPNVRIMDGGWSVYKVSQQTTKEYPRYKPGKLTAREQRTYVTIDEVKAAIGKPGIKFIDSRPNKSYTGETDTWTRNGHIPGAINIDWNSLMDADNIHKFKSLEQMQAIYDAKGITKADDIIVYCGTSREASVEYTALKHLLRYPKVRLYEGSWTEYSAHTELPIETGNP